MIETDVLIVGGSLVGLSAATFLSWHGVKTLSVERHHGTAIHPRAGHFHLRTLEVLRSVGLEARVPNERCVAFVHSAIGLPGVKVEIEDIAAWRAVAEVAGRFTQGRVFLVGDAAHTMPPMGGFGGNTGVQDTHNLAWKMALVLKGLAGPDLLATYDSERQPVGELAIQQAYSRYVLRVVPERGKEGIQPLVDDLSMEIGYRYHSPAIVSEAGTGLALYEDPRRSKAMPGTRAPHVPLQRDGARISTLDLFGKNFCVLAGANGAAYCNAARDAAAGLGLPLDPHRVAGGENVSDPDGRFADEYGLSDSGHRAA
jgi:putative polyketide hydroxylase